MPVKKDRNRFVRSVEGASPAPDLPSFFTREPGSHATFEGIPRPVRAPVAQASLLRGISHETLASCYGLPIDWADRIVDESTQADMEDAQFGASVPLGATTHRKMHMGIPETWWFLRKMHYWTWG